MWINNDQGSGNGLSGFVERMGGEKGLNEKTQIPEPYQKDIRRAIEILKEAGCADVFLFGSLATGEVHHESDIDLAIRGCPKGYFFFLLGRLLLELDRHVDLVNLDQQDAFARYLKKEGELLRIA